nr:hypothetical protein [uncultured bacterium]
MQASPCRGPARRAENHAASAHRYRISSWSYGSGQVRACSWQALHPPDSRRESRKLVSSATCITAPCARGVADQFRALSGADMYPASVAAIVMPRARMVFADQVPNQRRVLAGTLLQAGSSDPVSRPLRQTSPCPLPLRRPRDLDGLHRCGRSPVDVTVSHQSPDDARHLVRQRDPHQHRRLARQHSA